MKSKYGVTAKLIWDGDDQVRIPSELGTPALNQMKGTFSERLSELSGRTCYDSLGKGRSSEDYHKHILEVGHGSVYEHANICVMIEGLETHFGVFLNRPGIWVRSPARNKVVLTVNPRSLIDWHRWRGCQTPESAVYDAAVAEILAYYGEQLWPQIMPPTSRLAPRLDFINQHACVVPPVDEEEKWISMFMSGSRGFSHEIVRHGERTGISQRSTRFVAEDESEWVDHPLVQEYDRWLWGQSSDDAFFKAGASKFMEKINALKTQAKAVYRDVVETLQPWLVERGIDKGTARKQARGAARGYLGNALSTELVFSASVAQWKRMMRMRCCGPADAEIRAVFVEALLEFRDCRYADSFKDFELVPSSDGMGSCAVEKA